MTEQIKPKNFYIFLEALTVLSNKYGVVVAGCGCCGSPYLANTCVEDGKYKIDGDYEGLHFGEKKHE